MTAAGDIARSDARLLRSDGLQRWLLVRGGHELYLRKELEPSLALDGRVARAWLARAEQNRSLRAEGCAEVLDAGLDASGVWLSSRYDEGITLAEAMRGEVSIGMALHAARSILAALEAARGRELVHLDLDPEGILVRADGALLLPEFRLWSALAPAELARVRFDVGRVAYLSPELVQARAVDARSDLFVVGWLLYEWLGRAAPFFGDHPLALAMAIDRGQHVALAELAPRVPAALCDVVEMLLQTDPGCRFQTAGAALGALDAVATFEPARAQRELAARVAEHARAEPRTHLGLGLARLGLAAPRAGNVAAEAGMPEPPALVAEPVRAQASPLASAIALAEPVPPAPPPVREPRAPSLAAPAPRPGAMLENPFVASAAAPNSALIAPPPLLMPSAAPAPKASRSQVRAPRAQAVQGEPVHDGRTAFLRVESALRTVLPRKWQTARTVAPRAVVGKWQEPSSTLFRVRRAALAGPVIRVAAWPRAWWIALGLGLGAPVLACLYLLCRLWF